jgi:pimeloyl-ACP methyl ester carboxylesterase
MTPVEPVSGAVQCLSTAGLHVMRYRQWGDPRNPRVLVCVHGLSRNARDFDPLARALSDRFRVVCPDVAGRGQSDWIADPDQYRIRQYVSDMVTLVARLDVEQVAWLGTSMGGLIGLCFAGLPQSPVSRLILNDIGPRMQPAALERIATYIGQPVRFADLEEAVAYTQRIAAGFGMKTQDQWREITRSSLRPDGDGFVFNYDPRISVQVRASSTPEAIQTGEKILWSLYDAIACPTLVIRGALSDLLSDEGVAQMTQRGPRARVATVAAVGHAPMFFEADQIGIVESFLTEDFQ